MTRVAVDFRGKDPFLRKLRDGINDGLNKSAEYLGGRIRRNFGSEGGTRTGNKAYTAAPPGRFPGVRTGRLRNSITRDNARDLSVRVGTNVKYGLMLERGTSRMQPRPWLLRSLNQERGNIQRVFVREATRSASRRVRGVRR